MKSAVLSFLAATFFALNVAKADDVATFNIGKTDVKVEAANKRSLLTLELKNTKPEDAITVQILDNNDAIVYDETLKGNQSYNKAYDMSLLTDGVYELVVVKSNVKAIQTFRLDKLVVNLDEYQAKMVFAPTVKQQGTQVLLHLLLPETGKVGITVLDESLKAVWGKKYRDVSTLSQVYDISTLKSGKYTIVIRTAEDTYYHDIMVP